MSRPRQRKDVSLTIPEPLPRGDASELLVRLIDCSTSEDLRAIRDEVVKKYGDPPPLRVLVHLHDLLDDLDYFRFLAEWKTARRGLPYTEPVEPIAWNLEVSQPRRPARVRGSS